MKNELVTKITKMSEALVELQGVWDNLDWSEVPDCVTENYPFHKDLESLSKDIQYWLEKIKQS